MADRRRSVQAVRLQRDHRRVHHGAEHHLRRPARDPDVQLPGRPVHLERREFNAIRAGAIDVAYVDFDDVPQLPTVLRLGYSYFGEPDFGLTFAAYNYKDTTGDFNNIIAQLYIRQALAHLVDQQGWITAFMHGAGAPAYGPIPAYPQSPYLPADAATNPYPFSVSTAVSILKANGWTVNPGGTDVCAKAGTAAGNCGAGIPAGTKLAWNYIYSSSPTLIGNQATDFASKAKQAGINITLSSSNFNYMIANYLDPSAPANVNKWAMEDFGGETDVPYATTFGLFNTGGPSQVGDYSNPTADSLINASIAGGDPAAVKDEASFLTENQPVQFQPNPDIRLGLEEHAVGDEPAGLGEPDPVLRHAGVLVLQLITIRLTALVSGRPGDQGASLGSEWAAHRQKLRLVVATRGHIAPGTGKDCVRKPAEDLGEGGRRGRRFCGAPPLPRQSFTPPRSARLMWRILQNRIDPEISGCRRRHRGMLRPGD